MVAFSCYLPLLQDASDIVSSISFLKGFSKSTRLMGHLPWFGKHWPTPDVFDGMAHSPRPSEQTTRKKQIPGSIPDLL